MRNNGGYLRINLRTNGEIVASLPKHCSTTHLTKFIDDNRATLRGQLAKIQKRTEYHNGDQIGRRHKLVIRSGVRYGSRSTDNKIIVTIPTGQENSAESGRVIREAVAKALKLEAKSYLPHRLRYFALKYNYSYDRIRLTYAKSRWGSCSASGTISLNIALMNLPEDLIDYVLLHELTHTHHMNHGTDFWRELESICPNAKTRRDRMRDYTPYI